MKKLFKIDGREDWKALRNGLIPGGAHTYSKGDDQFPENAPPALESGRGAWTRAPDGKRYLDMGMGLRSVTLGHCYKPVVAAVAESLRYGSNLSRPTVFEAKYAENLLKALKWPAMVKLCKNGSTATSAAVKLARAYTGRKLIARCRQQPFFSYDDWFIGTTVCPGGVPSEISALTVAFDYGDLASVDRLISQHPGQLSCLILEPATDRPPAAGFLQGLRQRCDKHGIVLIFDEMILGFRLALGGGSELFGVKPDLATFGKGMANGFSMAALVGRREIMELGDLAEGRRKVFLLSTTHGAEISGLFAAQAALNEYQRKPVLEGIARFGVDLKAGFNAASARQGLGEAISIAGFDASPILIVQRRGKPDAELRTLFMQGMLARGVLMPYLAPCFSHGEKELAFLLKAFEAVAPALREAVKSGKVREKIVGALVMPVFREVN